MATHSDTKGVIDNDKPFEIDVIAGKIIRKCEKNTIVQFNHNSERFSFEMPRYVEGHDMLNCNKVIINYLNDNEQGLYEVDDLAVKEADDSRLTLSWLISGNATQYTGGLSFAIMFECTESDGAVTYRWNTEINNDFQIVNTLEGINEDVAYAYVDILEQWKQALFSGGGAAVKTASPYKGKTIVAFGDSIIAGWGWKEGTGVIQPLKEKYTDGTWLNKAESGANMAITSNPAQTPIVTQIRSYTGPANAIIFDGGVNDVNNGISIGSITSGYDATYDTSTFCGAMESALQYIMDNYPLAVKLFVIPHSFAKDNSYVDGIYAKAIEICDKWNMPVLDMRKYAQIAMTAMNKAKYTYNPNTGEGDTVHGNELFYRTFYSPIIDQTLQRIGIGYSTVTETSEIISVTGVVLNLANLSIKKGESVTLVATVQPTNATNQSVKWSTSNSNITVNNGTITGKAIGTSIVTVTTDDGGYTAQCFVNVAEDTVDPDESHTELESLSVDGNCYFDTGILPDQDTNTEVKLYIQSGTAYICGARDDSYKYGYTKTDNFYAIRGTVSSAAKNSAYWEDEWIIKQNGSNVMFNSNTVTLDAADSFTLTSPFYVGNMSKNNEPAGTGLIGKVYYAKIYSESELVADMIPVKKKDGTLCLYDKVRKKYLYKSGSGTVAQ